MPNPIIFSVKGFFSHAISYSFSLPIIPIIIAHIHALYRKSGMLLVPSKRSSSHPTVRIIFHEVMNSKIKSSSSWLMYLFFAVCSFIVLMLHSYWSLKFRFMLFTSSSLHLLMNLGCWYSIPQASFKCQVLYSVYLCFRSSCYGLSSTSTYEMM